MAFFSRTFGPVSRHCLTEIVPGLPTVKVRVIEPTASRRCVTLFTDGMSAVPMKTTKTDTGYELAELFIELPPDWPYRKLSNAEFNWPIRWLRWASRFPHQNAQSLGGPVLFVDVNEAVAIAPNRRFSAMLLLAETSFMRSDGRTIHLYRLFPLYPEEVALSQNKDIAVLFRAFDAKGVKFVIDMDRVSAAPPGCDSSRLIDASDRHRPADGKLACS